MKEIINDRQSKSYTEYRTGLLYGLTDFIANKSLQVEDQRKAFIDGVRNSKDINNILYENDLCGRLDENAGLPKFLLTYFGKWCEAKLKI